MTRLKNPEQKDFMQELFGPNPKKQRSLPIEPAKRWGSRRKKGLEGMHQDGNPNPRRVRTIRDEQFRREYQPRQRVRLAWLRSEGLIPPKPTKGQMHYNENK